MKGKLLIVAAIVTFSSLFKAQTVSLDNTFATNGYYVVPEKTNGWAWSKSMLLDDGKIIFVGDRQFEGGTYENEEAFIGRLNSDGSVDTTFGTNGFITYDPDWETFHPILFEVGDDLYIYYGDARRLVKVNLVDGMIDVNFGINGVVEYSDAINYLNHDSGAIVIGDYLYLATEEDNYTKSVIRKVSLSDGSIVSTKVLDGISNSRDIFNGPNGTIIIRSEDDTNYKIYLSFFDIEGNIISTFGNNGTVEVNSFDNTDVYESSYDDIKTDGNSIYYASSNENEFYGIIKKIDNNGQLVSSFGVNGIATIENSFFSEINLFNDKIYFSGANVTNGNTFNLMFGRLKADGSFDETFNGNGIFVESTNNLQEWSESFNVLNDNAFIAVGESIIDADYDNIYVAKFILTEDLGVSEVNDSESIIFQNPVNDKLKYNSSKEVSSIALYSIDGKLMKVIKDDSTDLSSLKTGTYIAKVTFASGETVTKKIIKE